MTPVGVLFAVVLAAPGQLVLAEQTVRVGAAGWLAFEVILQPRIATVVCSFEVLSGPAVVRVELIQGSELRRIETGQRHRALASTPLQQRGGFRYTPHAPGVYAILIDNRTEASEPAEVRLKVSLDFVNAEPEVGVLSPRRRLTIVALSLLGFFAIVWWSGRRLFRAMRGQRSCVPPPPYG